MKCSKVLTAITLAVGLVVVAFSVAGYTAQKKFEGVTIRIVNESSSFSDAQIPLYSKFTEETGIKVEHDEMSYDVMYEKLKVGFIGGAVEYDLMGYDHMWTAEFARRDWFLNLDDFLKDPDLTPKDFDYPDDFFGVFLSGGYPAGNRWELPVGTWGIPFIAGFRPLYYRTDLLKEAGLVDPFGNAKPPDTLDELLEYAQKLNNPEKGVYGFTMPAKRTRIFYDWLSYLWTYRGELFDKDFKPVFNSPAGVKAMEMYVALGKVAPPGVAAYHISECWQSFMMGKAALAWTWQDLPSVAREQSEIVGKYKAAPSPVYAGERRPFVGGCVFSIPKQAKHPEAAFRYITWLLSSERAKELTLAGGTVQRKSTWDDPEVEEMYVSGAGDIEDECVQKGRRFPPIPEMASVDHIIAEELSKVFIGEKEVKKALDDAARKVEDLMREAGYYD